MSKPKITVDVSAIEKAYSPAELKVKQAVFAQRVGFDMNEHCPEDEHALHDSMPVASDFENGQVIWDTPYAKRVYNLDRLISPKNPNAKPHWAEATKGEKLGSWKDMAAKLLTGGSARIGGAE